MIKDLYSLIYEKLRLKEDYEKTFNTEHGKRVLRHLMKVAGIPKKQANFDPNALLAQEGMQFIIYTIFRVLNTDPQTLQEKIEESYNELEETHL